MSRTAVRFRAAVRRIDPLFAVVRLTVLGLAGVAGLGVLTMMVVTCTDVVLRLFGSSLTGAVDLVTLAGAVTIACALPYTTAVKGHVAIEFFFQKLGRRGRVIVDSVVRLLLIVMFAAVCRESLRYGHKLRASHEVTMTLKIPIFWVPYVIALGAAMLLLVVLWHLLHPGREMIRP